MPLSNVEHPRHVVGFIKCSHPTSVPEQQCFIVADESILIGRSVDCDLAITDDQAISNQHLRIYCVIYDKSDDHIKPMIYAEDLSSNGSYWNGSFMGMGRGGILLSNKDELRLSPRVLLTFFTLVEYEKDCLKVHQQVESKYFQKHYEISSRVLGFGAHGKVYMAVNLIQGHQVACKVVDIQAIRTREARVLIRLTNKSEKNIDSHMTIKNQQFTNQCIARNVDEAPLKVAREVDILKSLRHPNVMCIEKAFKTDNTIYIFEELVAGGDLISLIDFRGGKLHEAEAGIIIRQLLEAMKYLHQRDVAHRDVKPENVLVASLTAGARVVLTDFGSAIQVKSCSDAALKRMDTRVGTLEYTAPEIIMHNFESRHRHEGYTKAVDLWSLGCVTTVLLTGSSPFQNVFALGDDNFTDQNVQDIMSAWDHKNFTQSMEWQLLSERPRDFIYSLLVVDSTQRLTAEQAMSHHWLTNEIVREAFDMAYKKAVTGWEAQAPTLDITQSISNFPESETSARANRKRS